MSLSSIFELSQLQNLLFNLEGNLVESVCSTIIRSNYFEDDDKLNRLLSNISLSIEFRPKQINEMIDLCILLNKVDQTNSFSTKLLKFLLIKLSQEHQFFIFKAYHCNLFPLTLIESSIQYLINSGLEKKAYNLARWFSKEFSKTRLLKDILSFKFLKTTDQENLKKEKNIDFILRNPISLDSKVPLEIKMYEILRTDNVEYLEKHKKDFLHLMLNEKHFFSYDSIYMHFCESEILLDEKLSVFDICSYYNSFNCFELLNSYIEESGPLKPKQKQSLAQELTKSFNVLHFAIAGNSFQIIQFLIEHDFPFDNCIEAAIYFHQNDLVDFFMELKQNQPIEALFSMNVSSDIWETPLFQACHSNNVEMILKIIHYKSLQLYLNLPKLPPQSSSSSISYPNSFFYNLEFYLFMLDNIIKAKNAIGKENEDENLLFHFKNDSDAEHALSSLFSSIKHTKEMLTYSLFFLCRRGFSDILEMMIVEFSKICRLTEKILSEMPSHEYDNFLNFSFDINTTDKNGNTLLITAAKNNNLSCIKSLLNLEQVFNDHSESYENISNNLKINIDANIANNEQKSALEYGCFNGNDQIVKEILSTDQINVDTLHKALIACLRCSSFYNRRSNFQIFGKILMHHINDSILYLLYPYSYVIMYTYDGCKSFGRKVNKNNPQCFRNITNSIINSLRASSKISFLESLSTDDSEESSSNQNPLYFTMHHQTIENYSIVNDNLEIFQALMKNPEFIKSLSIDRCTQIIENAIKNNATKILNYIFTNSKPNKDNSESNECPIIINEKINFLNKAIHFNAFNSISYLFSLGKYDIKYDEIFSALEDPEVVHLIAKYKYDTIASNINFQSKANFNETLLTKCAQKKYIETFKFLMFFPTVNINASGSKYDPINESYNQNSPQIFALALKHPTLDVSIISWVDHKAMQKAIDSGDVIACKAVMDKSPKLDICNYNLMNYASKSGNKDIIDYFNDYLKKQGKTYSPYTSYSPNSTHGKVADIEPLEKSIVENDFEAFKSLITKDNINIPFERNGVTPLSAAVYVNNTEAVKYLLSQPDIDINQQNKLKTFNNTQYYSTDKSNPIDKALLYSFYLGETPLIASIRMKHINSFKLLIADQRIDVNKESADKTTTPLIISIKSQNLGTQKSKDESNFIIDEHNQKVTINNYMLNSLLEREDININKECKNTAFVEAINSNNIYAVKRIVELFGNSSNNKQKVTFIYDPMKVYLTGKNEIKQILIKDGMIKDDTKSANSYLGVGTSSWMPPLKSSNFNFNFTPDSIDNAIVEGNFEALKNLINKNSINKHFERNGMTPLNTAIHKSDIQMIKYLLEFDGIDVNLENEIRDMSHYATYYPTNIVADHFDNIQKSGISVGETPLITAIRIQNSEIIKLLLSNSQVDINKISKDKKTNPIMQAIKSVKIYSMQASSKPPNYEKKMEIIKLLLSNNDIDLNLDMINTSPMIEAINSNNVDVVRLVLEQFYDSDNADLDKKKHKLDLNKKNFQEQSVLDLASKNHFINNLFIERGLLEKSENDWNFQTNNGLNYLGFNYNPDYTNKSSSSFQQSLSGTNPEKNPFFRSPSSGNSATQNIFRSHSSNSNSRTENPFKSFSADINYDIQNPFGPTLSTNNYRTQNRFKSQSSNSNSRTQNPFSPSSPNSNKTYFNSIFPRPPQISNTNEGNSFSQLSYFHEKQSTSNGTNNYFGSLQQAMYDGSFNQQGWGNEESNNGWGNTTDKKEKDK